MVPSKVRVFQSDLLEACTRVHPLIPLLIWLPVVFFLITYSLVEHSLSPTRYALLAVGAALSWSLVEYCLHRFFFHFPAQKAWSQRLVFIFHGLHHEDAQDKMRLVMPPVPALLYVVILFALFQLLLGAKNAPPFMAFFLLCYLAYDYIHYGTHHFAPRTRIGKFLRRHHLQHHARHDINFGVSLPLWDYIFGTAHKCQRSSRHDDA